jgi:PKD repeat protein
MKRKSLLSIVILLSYIGISAQTECQVNIISAMNKSLPPSYTFTSDFEGKDVKYYWYFSDETKYEEPSPTHTFKYSGNYTVSLKILDQNGKVCYGRTAGFFEGKDTLSISNTIYYAKGWVKDMSSIAGCGLTIVLEDGKSLMPLEMLPKFELKTGQFVSIAYEIMGNIMTICMTGTPVKIHKIEEIPVTEPVYMEAKGVVTDLSKVEGCGLVIAIDSATMLVPVEIVPDFKLEAGQTVHIVYEILHHVKLSCGLGQAVKIHRIQNVSTNSPTILSGKGRVKDMSEMAGCGLVIYLESGRTLIPAEIVPNFVLKDGQYIELAFEVLDGYASACDMGTVVRIHKVAEIAPVDPGCAFDPVFKLVDEAKMTYQFWVKTNSKVAQWYWEFGDGNTSNEAEPKHTYENAGVYTVVCTIVTADECKTSKRLVLVIEKPGLPSCPGALSLLLFDPSAGNCDGKAVATLIDEKGTELKDVVYLWSNGEKGNVAGGLCADKPYYLYALIEGVCQKNTSFTFLSKPTWRVTATDGKYTFHVINPIDGMTYLWDFGDGYIAYGTSVTYDYDREGTYNVRLTAIMGAASRDTEQTFNAEKTLTSVPLISNPDWKVYPNPARDIVYINPEADIHGTVRIEITDIQGRRLIQQQFESTGSTNSIHISHLPAGIYFLKLASENRSWPAVKLLVAGQ